MKESTPEKLHNKIITGLEKLGKRVHRNWTELPNYLKILLLTNQSLMLTLFKDNPLVRKNKVRKK